MEMINYFENNIGNDFEDQVNEFCFCLDPLYCTCGACEEDDNDNFSLGLDFENDQVFPSKFCDEDDMHSVDMHSMDMSFETEKEIPTVVEKPVPQQAYMEKSSVSVQIENPKNMGSVSYHRETTKVPVNLQLQLLVPLEAESLKRKRTTSIWMDNLETLRKKRKLNSKEKKVLKGLENGEKNIARYEELKSRDELTIDEMAEKKLLKNRVSAFASRQKKKNEVEELKRDNAWLLKENARFMALLEQNGISY